MADTPEEQRRRALASARAARSVNDDVDLPSEMADEADDEGFFSFVARANRRRAEAIERATGTQATTRGVGNVPRGPREGQQPATPEPRDLTESQANRRAEAAADARDDTLSREEKNRRARARIEAADEEARRAREALLGR